MFEFLEKLSEGARGVTEREQALVRQYRLKKGDLEKAHEEALSSCRESAAEALAAAEAVIDGTTAGIDGRYEHEHQRLALSRTLPTASAEFSCIS